MQNAYLITETGQVFKGQSFGAEGTAFGQLIFTTDMTGIVSILTDPSYYGTIVMPTFPLAGNFGIALDDCQGDRCFLSALVVREYCETPSNFRCDMSLDAFLKEKGVIAISGIDTRHITQTIRDYGVLNAVVTTKDPSEIDVEDIRNFTTRGAVKAVATTEKQYYQPAKYNGLNVAFIDCGAKNNIPEILNAKGCRVVGYGPDVTASELLKSDYDGIVIGNGPGDPRENTELITEIKKLLGKVPMFGVNLGHQLMALAAGLDVTGLKFGHHGACPVKDLKTQKVLIAAQSHLHVVYTLNAFRAGAVITHTNVNDGTCEGLEYPKYKSSSIQFALTEDNEMLAGFIDTMKG